VTGDRVPLHTLLTERAWQAWHDFAAAHGASTTAVVEVIGQKLAAGELDDGWAGQDLAQRARHIDTSRRSRTSKRPTGGAPMVAT
jgi:hypothetical protein